MTTTAEATAWQADAVCATSAVDHWNSGDHSIGRAKEICRTCPAMAACLDYAMSHPGCRGVWGATSERQRRAMRRERRHRVSLPVGAE